MPFKAFAAAALTCLALAAPAGAAGEPNVAALQVALRARGAYAGAIDGLRGPRTSAAVRRFQRGAGLVADGVVGVRTRAALGRLGRPRLGRRSLVAGKRGWDVAALQFLLAWHGFPSGTFDGDFGAHTDAALRRYQRWARLPGDGVAGPATLASLRSPRPHSPLSLAWPMRARLGDRFGPRGDRFHAGLDFPADYGAGVFAARSGRVVRAGWDASGYGFLVRIAHSSGVRTMYAHLSAIHVRRGQWVAAGSQVGLVGASGHATGPHLHFEVRVRGAAVDPLRALR